MKIRKISLSITAAVSLTLAAPGLNAVAGRFSQEADGNAKVWRNFKHIDEAKPVCGINVENIRYIVGDGANLYAVTIDFNNDERLDNLVLGYRTNSDAADPTEVVKAIAQADKRLEIEDNGTGISSVKFDLDGNNELDVKDAIRVNDSANIWHVEYAMNASDEETPVISLHYAPADTAEPDRAAPYYFYLPGPDEQGVWVPEEMTVKLSDAGFVLPVLVQPQGAKISNTSNWQASSKNTSYLLDKKIITSPYTSVDGSYHARPVFVGATGTTYMRFRPMINGKWCESNYMTLNVDTPEIPATAISFAEEELTSGLNNTVEYTLNVTPENATYTGVTFTISDKTIASWSATAGLKTLKKEGETAVTAEYNCNKEIKASFILKSQLLNPVTGVNFGPGTEDGIINVPVRRIVGLKPVITPENADIPEVKITLTDNGTSRDDMTCSTYNVNWWDINNVRSQFLELSGHRPTGDHPAKLHVTSADGKYEADFVVNVIEADRTPLEGGYTEGTIILNEEWFGHTNGGLNYFTEDGEVIYQAYEKENPGMAFGATSQHGIIWNDKLIVASKQAQDGGDPMPGGGRLVIADASTLKRFGSLDLLEVTDADGNKFSGDGRAVCGATPDKVYVSSNNGIYVVDITDAANPVITGRVAMNTGNNNNLYNGQVGDMVNSCGHVFAIMQKTGLLIIDTDTDKLNEATVHDEQVQGVTQSADGNVWYCTIGKDESGAACSVFVAIDPETLEEVDRVSMPASLGTVVCGWGAWRSTAFKGSYTGNDLWFVTGAAGIMGGATGDYYRYTIGDDPKDIKAFFTLSDKTGINGFGEEVGLMTYGTPLYDPRSNQLIVMAGRKGAASGGYRDHWTMWVNADTGEIDRKIKLEPYYWFQSLPILPDKYDVEINLDDIEVPYDNEPLEYDLNELVDDPDNINRNIRISLEGAPMIAAEMNEDEVTVPAEVKLEGRKLTVTPHAEGNVSFAINAESNGRLVTKNINVSVNDGTNSINEIDGSRSILFKGTRLHINGHIGEEFTVYSLNGEELIRFVADSDNYVLDFSRHPGVYVVSGSNGSAMKIIVK
ncbi:MAG: DUF5074 domain-containing protein [Candidatus Amulumruptor caecigallinarius]|nr:DUF5074 domain-containing protein [Candidatus Amulumruptor caecigallinarius]